MGADVPGPTGWSMSQHPPATDARSFNSTRRTASHRVLSTGQADRQPGSVLSADLFEGIHGHTADCLDQVPQMGVHHRFGQQLRPLGIVEHRDMLSLADMLEHPVLFGDRHAIPGHVDEQDGDVAQPGLSLAMRLDGKRHAAAEIHAADDQVEVRVQGMDGIGEAVGLAEENVFLQDVPDMR